MDMKDLRERAEKLALSVHGNNLYPHQAVELLEAFAREIRDEALEEAMAICRSRGKFITLEAIRALKTDALAAAVSGDK